MEKELIKFINLCTAYLEEDAVKEVMHFYNHGECEMSLEGLTIELINLNVYPREVPIKKLKELLVYYQLDKESIFDIQIWRKFLDWENKNLNDSSRP